MRVLAIALASLALAACQLITGPIEDRYIGAIGYPDEVEIGTPVIVNAGEEFTVTVRTIGPNGCWRKDRTDVSVQGLSATITPYDVYRHGRDIACTDMVVYLTHTATLSFAQAGTAQVVIQGRDGTVQREIIVE